MINNSDKMQIQTTLEEELKIIDEKTEKVKKDFGDIELRDVTLEKAALYQKYNQHDQAIQTYTKAMGIASASGKKMDITFSIIAINIKTRSLYQIQENLDTCYKLLEVGGDWERKTKLKIYQGIYSLLIRDFQDTANVFIEILPTFNSPDILSMQDFVFYTVLVSIIALPRADLQKKIFHSPDINSTIRSIPNLQDFLDSFFKCDQKSSFKFCTVQNDQFLGTLQKYFIREMRIRAYSQFLESYQTVKLKNIAEAFGVSQKFIDKDLSELIASRRLYCKIDQVEGSVESEHYDDRNNHFSIALKNADYLLNQVQKLSRVIDV